MLAAELYATCSISMVRCPSACSTLPAAMCGALHYCHKKAHVVHRDLKLDNMLLTGSDEILLADFGFVEYVGPSNKRLRLLCGSPHYSAPEIFAQQEYSGTAADMWSLGVLMYTAGWPLPLSG